jgi:hypothetical protein
VLRAQRQVEAAMKDRQGREPRAGRRRAVVAALQRNELFFRWLADGVVVLHDETHGGIDGLGAAERHVHPGQRSGRDLHQLLGKANGRLAAEVKVAGGVRQAPHLFGRSLHHALLAVAHVHAPEAREGVEQFMPVRIGEPCATCRGQHGGAALLVRAPG